MIFQAGQIAADADGADQILQFIASRYAIGNGTQQSTVDCSVGSKFVGEQNLAVHRKFGAVTKNDTTHAFQVRGVAIHQFGNKPRNTAGEKIQCQKVSVGKIGAVILQYLH